MGKNCCVPKCRSQTGIKNGSESMKGMFSMHVFPSDPDLRNSWIKNVGRPNWEPTPNSTICSLHFEENNYLGAKYLGFFSSHSLKTREKYISFAQFVYFLREVCLLFNF